ncbi:hypothetical protein KGP54_18910 [Burkholderia multivorans]|uniref:hypothetical protein n=1 Tax=Burkholderia multivorans TaxID=87883 RepID=UPI0020A1F5D4|nr:hypothetical protein [Burkholderia multivorans]MCO8353470.1 hypothetical protein [Burkholderia multivorans]MCO8385729.1 hypothetical protein [Burkholderia multivorans]MCO8406590.1 hypothetical protein [Burkholderia multivorans]MCO8434825.1 hypothetical protein [Burkholderia multivorans]MCO8460699.1 hypothetical protein [Burkholderia multivorans]
MAREQIRSGSSLWFGYNPVVGWLMEVSPRSAAILREVRDGFEPEAWKAGFTGHTGLTLEARRRLAAHGLQAEALSGEIVAAYYAEQLDAARGLSYPYLRVKLVDGDEAYLVSLALGSGPAQMLAQKLLAVTPGERVRLMAFGKIDNGYANHAVSLKNGQGHEIRGPGGLFREAETLVQDEIAALHAQGLDSREQVAGTRARVKLAFHRRLIEDRIAPAFAAWADRRNGAGEPAGQALASGDDPHAEAGAASAFDDAADGVPF